MFKTKNKVLLIPYFWDHDLYNKIKKESIKNYKVYLSEHLIFNEFSIITGFIGYPQIITLLSLIEDIKEKDFFFLGTAGAINESIKVPVSINITEIYSSSIYKLFSKKRVFPLNTIIDFPIKRGKCVSIDLPYRETKKWLKAQRACSIDAVEMEIFPIRAFIKKPFTAIIIITDKVKGDQKINLFNKKLILIEFNKSFIILKNILEKII